MGRLLLTCPTRGRPELFNKMVETFEATKSEGTHMIAWIDEDDKTIEQYKKFGLGWHVIIRPRKQVAQIHNQIVKDNPKYQYYMPINDDIIFHTQGWDEKLIKAIKDNGNGWGISYGDDMTNNHAFNLPTFGMVSANIVNTLGYIYPLELKALFGDTYLLDIGRATGKLFYVGDVVIQHKQPGFYIEEDVRISKEFDKEEREAYAKYIDTKLDSDVNKLFEAIVKSQELQEAGK